MPDLARPVHPIQLVWLSLVTMCQKLDCFFLRTAGLGPQALEIRTVADAEFTASPAIAATIKATLLDAKNQSAGRQAKTVDYNRAG